MVDGLTAAALAEGFFYLQADARHQFTQILTRPFRNVPSIGLILIGMDPDGLRHLLIPVSDDTVIPRGHAAGPLRFGLREMGSAGRFLNLTCTELPLSYVFERLCADVVDRLEGTNTTAVPTVKSALDDWRALFSGGTVELSRESLIGLIGELEVLTRLARQEPVAALESWVGPSGALHDFAFAGTSLEVKSTSSQDGGRVTISSLDQLDPHTTNVLYLAVVHVRPDDSAPTVDDRLRALIDMGVPSYTLIQKTADYGHVFESGKNNDAVFALQDIRYWRVTEEFPGLRRSDLRGSRLVGIERVKYDLLVDTAGTALTAAERLEMEKSFAWNK